MKFPSPNLATRMTALVFCGLFFSHAHAEKISGQVISIADGDTLTLQDAQTHQHQIRLAGIDAPELTQDFGQQAKTHLANLALNQQVTADCKKTEPNRLEICAVTIGGNDIGLEQIRKGMAWWYQQNAAELPVQTQTNYRQTEFNAKIHRLGFWNSKNPTPPWVWRHGRSDE